MRGILASRALFGALTLSGCVGASLPEIDLELGGVCHALHLEIAEQPLVIEHELLGFAASDRDGAGWALVAAYDRLWLGRIDERASVIPPAIDLGLTPEDAKEVRVLAGPAPGEVWATHMKPNGIQVWHLRDAELLAEHDLIGFLPPSGFAHEHYLLFAGLQPVILASPTGHSTGRMLFNVAILEPDGEISERWIFFFGSTCADDPSCIPAYYPKVKILDVAEADGSDSALVLYEFERNFAGISTRTTGVATFEFQLVDSPEGRIVRGDKREYADLMWGHTVTEVTIDPGQIARDSRGHYIIAGVTDGGTPGDEPAVDELLHDRLLHYNLLSRDNTVVARLPKYTRSHLLQLVDQVGLGQAFDGSWKGTRIVDTDIDFSAIGQATLPGRPTISRAGRGQALLRTETASLRGTFRCVD